MTTEMEEYKAAVRDWLKASNEDPYYAEPDCPASPPYEEDTADWYEDDTGQMEPDAAGAWERGWAEGWEAGKKAGVEWMRRLEMG